MTNTTSAPRPRPVASDDVRVGDSIEFLGNVYPIIEIEDYPTCPFGPARIARSLRGWGITLISGTMTNGVVR